MTITDQLPSFKVTKEISRKITAILKDAEKRGITQPNRRLDHQMDLTACHANGCPIDFDKLAGFDDFSLAHDIHGINNCLDHATGKLTNFFLPRCAA